MEEKKKGSLTEQHSQMIVITDQDLQGFAINCLDNIDFWFVQVKDPL